MIFTYFPHDRMAKANKTSPAHTAGPWQYHSTTEGQFAILGAYNAEKDAHKIICVTRGNNDEDRMNARLIAVAPEQHKALEQMVAGIIDMLDDDSLDMSGDCKDLLLQIAAIGERAIAKTEPQ
jgi:hypothetical protein